MKTKSGPVFRTKKAPSRKSGLLVSAGGAGPVVPESHGKEAGKENTGKEHSGDD